MPGAALLASAVAAVVLLLATPTKATTDPDTVALWLFDETSYPTTPLLDGTQNGYDLRLTPTGELAVGKHGNALRLAPGTNYNAYYSEWDGMVVFSYMFSGWGEICGLWGPTVTPEKLVTTAAGLEWTCEFWLKLTASPGTESAVLQYGYAYDPGVVVNLAAGGTSFLFTNNYGGWSAVCPVTAGSLTAGVWHHVAFAVLAIGSRVNLFVDGQLQSGTTWSAIPRQPLPSTTWPPSFVTTTYGVFDSSENYERFRQYRFNLSMGEDRHGLADLDGYLDEVRISSVARYTGNFIPPLSLSYNYGPGAPADSFANGPPIIFGTNVPTGVVPLGSRRHLFIDGALLATTNNVQWKVNVPRIEPLAQYFSGDLNVVDHAGEVWFVTPDGYESSQGLVSIWESADGMNFTAPSLGVVEYLGSTNNNLVLQHIPMWAGAFKDTNPNIAPDERFKMTGWVANSGIQLFTSGDLVHWKRNETMMLPLCSGGGSEAYWDDQNGYYKYFIKRDPQDASATCAYAGGRTAVGFQTPAISKEMPFQVQASPYWAGFSSPVVTCEGPIVFPTNSFGEVYRTRALKYPWAPDTYLAFVWRLSAERVRRTELMVSRDGTNWTGTGNIGLYLPTNMVIGSFTNGEAVMQFGMARRGSSLWQYANFNNGSHDYVTASAFARLLQRLDGFVSLDAGASTGLVTTRPLVFSGSRLALNLISTNGMARVALLDTNGVALPGYALSDCDPITADSVNYLATWHSNASIAALAGIPLRVQFELTQSKLYAMQFSAPGPVIVDTVEYWNGLENPHALDGVTLTGAGTAANPYIYTLPSSMTITANGSVWLSKDLTLGNTSEDTTIKLKFAAGDLQMNAGAVINTARPSRSGSMGFILDMGGRSIAGSGRILGLRGPGGLRQQKPRDLLITNAVDVALQDVDSHTENVSGGVGLITIVATNKVVVTGELDASDTQVAGGSSGGNILVKARQVTLNTVDTRALRNDGLTSNGSVEVRALEPGPSYNVSSTANTFSNRLTLNGPVLTAGAGPTIASGGVKFYGVPVQLNGGFGVTVPANGTLDVRAGQTNLSNATSNLFVNLSAQNPSVAYSVLWNNLAPGGSGPAFTTNQIFRVAAIAGMAYSNSIAGTATDPNGDALVYAKGTGSAWLTISNDGSLGGTPGTADVGTNTWKVSVTDGARFAVASLKIVVGTKPAFLSNPVTRASAADGVAYTASLQGAAQDLDGDALVFAKASGPTWLSVASDGTLSGIAGPADTFTNEWIVSVTDGKWTNAAFLRINVCGSPKFLADPVLKSPAWTNENYSAAGQTLAVNAVSPCGAPLTYAKVTGPAWLSVAANGALSGTPSAANLGTNTWTVSVSDGVYSATATLKILVPSPIVIATLEQWDGLLNPHAAHGVTLTGSGTAADPAVYTIPTHLRIAPNAGITMSTPPPGGGQDLPPDNSVMLKFTGFDLKVDTNGYINIGRRTRSNQQNAIFSMGGGSILGSGQISGIWNTTSSPRVLTIEGVCDVSLAYIDVHVENVNNSGRNLNIRASGRVDIGWIDNSDLQNSGGNAGDVNISAAVISVGSIRAFAARDRAPTVNNGNIALSALGAPTYDPNIPSGNTIQNRLFLSGLIATTTNAVTNLVGNITLQGVAVQLKPGFSVQKMSNATLSLNVGVYPNGVGAVATDVFSNATSNVLTPSYVVQWTTLPTMTTVRSPANPACSGSRLSFSATVTVAGGETPAGTVQFKTNGVNYGSAVPLIGGLATSPATTALPAGSSLITAIYAGNTNYGATTGELAQVIRSNSAPAAVSFLMGALSSTPATVRIIGGTRSPTDAQGDPLVVTAVTQGTNGTVTTDGTNVTYTATNLSAAVDTFIYTVGDGCANSPATITVGIIGDTVGFNHLTPVGVVGNNSIVLSYLGLPGNNCAMDWATNLGEPIDWQALVTNMILTNGLLRFTNTSPAPVNFYRSRYFP